MPSTLTAGIEVGKQSKKIERNSRKGWFCEIVCWLRSLFINQIAQSIPGAQFLWEHGLLAMNDDATRHSDRVTAIASKLCSYGSVQG